MGPPDTRAWGSPGPAGRVRADLSCCSQTEPQSEQKTREAAPARPAQTPGPGPGPGPGRREAALCAGRRPAPGQERSPPPAERADSPRPKSQGELSLGALSTPSPFPGSLKFRRGPGEGVAQRDTAAQCLRVHRACFSHPGLVCLLSFPNYNLWALPSPITPSLTVSGLSGAVHAEGQGVREGGATDSCAAVRPWGVSFPPPGPQFTQKRNGCRDGLADFQEAFLARRDRLCP